MKPIIIIIMVKHYPFASGTTNLSTFCLFEFGSALSDVLTIDEHWPYLLLDAILISNIFLHSLIKIFNYTRWKWWGCHPACFFCFSFRLAKPSYLFAKTILKGFKNGLSTYDHLLFGDCVGAKYMCTCIN